MKPDSLELFRRDNQSPAERQGTGKIRRQLVFLSFLILSGAALFGADEGKERWAFQPLRTVIPPISKDKRWVNNPIDSFVLAKLDAGKLKPAAPANRITL